MLVHNQQQISMVDPETGIKYLTNPCRDVAFFGPQIFELIGERCKPENLSPDDLTRLSDANLDPGEVFEAWVALTIFHKLAVDPEVKTPAAAVDACGFTARPWVAQSIVMRKYTQAMMGAVWAGLRSSAMNGECPAVVSNLIKTAVQLLNHVESK